MKALFLSAVAIPILAILYYVPVILSILFFILFVIIAICSGFFIAVYVHILLSSRHQTTPSEKILSSLEVIHKAVTKTDNDYSKKSPYLAVVFGRTVDGLLQQLMDLILRDFFAVFIKDLSFDSDGLVDNFREDLWGAVQNLHDRMCRIDSAKLIAVDMVTRITTHFEKIRIAQSSASDSRRSPILAVSPHLKNVNTELDYLRRVSEMCIMFLLPRGYSLTPAKYLIREVLACKILHPAIALMTSPEYINQKILNYLESQQQAKELRQKTHENAATFEDFLKMINHCNDVEELKGFRYHIVNEIMQTTTMQNLQRAKGVDPDQEKVGVGTSKSDVTAARKLKRYISQLSYAKAQCEKKLAKLGWEGGFPTHDEKNKALPLSTILETVSGRRHFGLFLETVASSGLLGFHTAVEELRSAHRSSWHQLGAEIFYTYIRAPSAEVKVDKEVRKRMEGFLLGDKGPEVFYEVQRVVLATLEEKYYPSFLLSQHYKHLLQAYNSEELSDSKEAGSLDDPQSDSASEPIGTLHVGDHSSYARRKLDQLQEKLNNKTQALQALQSSLKPESRVLSILEKEVEWLRGERRQLEAHLTRTETWGENLGKWRAIVQSAEIVDERSPPQFVLVVHMPEGQDSSDGGDICTGWVVLRSLTHFQELHRKLRPLCNEVKSLELPSNSFKFLFGKNDKSSLEKAKAQIQKYLEFVLEDDRLNQSEALYAFLSPSSEHLKHATPSPKKSRFSFSTLFKSGSGDSQRSIIESSGVPPPREEEEEISMYLDGADSTSSTNPRANTDIDGKDTIAEPLYALMGEVFDMRGVFKFLRRSLISFVQVTYGRTINRQIRDTVSYLSSEPMLHYYISQVIKCWWPGGNLATTPHYKELSKELKQAQRAYAGALLVNNVPQVLQSLVGARTAKRGAAKVFGTVQIEKANRQLFYELFELLVIEIFPELKQHQYN